MSNVHDETCFGIPQHQSRFNIKTVDYVTVAHDTETPLFFGCCIEHAVHD